MPVLKLPNFYHSPSLARDKKENPELDVFQFSEQQAQKTLKVLGQKGYELLERPFIDTKLTSNAGFSLLLLHSLEKEDAPPSMGDISLWQGSKPSNITGLIKSLGSDATRIPSERGDKRFKKVEFSETGKTKIEVILESHREFISEVLTDKREQQIDITSETPKNERDKEIALMTLYRHLLKITAKHTKFGVKDILKLFAIEGNEATQTKIAKELGLSDAVMHRYVKTSPYLERGYQKPRLVQLNKPGIKFVNQSYKKLEDMLKNPASLREEIL